MAQQAAETMDDGQPEPQPAGPLPRRVLQLPVFLEDGAQLVVRDADAGVPDLDARETAVAAGAEQDLAAGRVFERVRHQVAQHLFKQARVAVDDKSGEDDTQIQSLRLRLVGERAAQIAEQVVEREIDRLRPHHAGLDLIDVEQRIEHARHRADGVLQAADEVFQRRPGDPLRQQPLDQRQGLQRLAQIVAGGGQEMGLGDIGPLRLARGRLQRLGRVPASGDVGEGDHDALDRSVMRPVGHDAARPHTRRRFDLPLDRQEGLEHPAGIGGQGRVGGQ